MSPLASTTFICPRCHGAPASGVAEVCGYCHGQGLVADQVLSPHFLLSELLVSETAARRGIPNDPPDGYADRLRELTLQLLEPLRERFGALHINSGYRAPDVNRAIGGSAASAHMQGWAADLVPLNSGVTLRAMADWLIASGLAFDQVIFEGTWLHVGLFSPSGAQRREAQMMFGGKYSAYDPNDPRVAA